MVKVGLRNENHTLNLLSFLAELTVDCESCGYEIPMLKSEVGDLPEYIECSTCAGERKHAYRMKRLIEAHSKRLEDLDQIPPMIDIGTRDLPGFTKKIGETLSLFKGEPA